MGRSVGGIINALYTRGWLILMRLRGYKIQHRGIQHFAPFVELKFDKSANVLFGKNVYLRKNCSLKIRKNATLILGDGVMLNNGCIIGCHDSVQIGEGTIFGPGVYVYDHDHDYHVGLHDCEYVTSPVEIGRNCWIGAGTIILRGTKIGDNCIVGAGCVVKGEYPENQLIIQKRDTICKTNAVSCDE